VELGFFVFLINYFLYSSTFTIGGWISNVYLYFLAVLLAPQYRGFLTVCPTETVDEVFLRPRRRWTPSPGSNGTSRPDALVPGGHHA
jgi:hypothetical protein